MCERAVWVNFPAKLISAHSPTCSRLSAGGWVAQWALVQVGGAAAEKTPEVGNWVTKCISCVRRNISAYGGRLTEPQQCRRNEKRKTETREQEPKARHGHRTLVSRKNQDCTAHTHFPHDVCRISAHTNLELVALRVLVSARAPLHFQIAAACMQTLNPPAALTLGYQVDWLDIWMPPIECSANKLKAFDERVPQFEANWMPR